MARKEFTIKEDNGKEVKLVIRTPQYEDHEQADRIYAGTVANLVRDRSSTKLLLRQEAEDYIRRHNIWTDEDEKAVEKLNEEVDTILNKIRKGGDKLSNGRKLCIEAMDKRKKIVALAQKKQVLYDATIESVAEGQKIEYMVYKCTVYAADGKEYWASFEDMKNDKSSEAYRKAVPLVMDTAFGINQEFEKNLPENKWLKKYGFIDDSLNYTDRKTGSKVDRDGNPIEDIEKQATRQIANLIGDIQEEVPFIDDETGKPVKIAEKVESKKTEESKEEKIDEAVTT